MTWDEVVGWYRGIEQNASGVLHNYFDIPVTGAAVRFANSEEFLACKNLVGPSGEGKKLLDLGSGNGIASYAWARCGYDVSALEPDPSGTVGRGAIKEIRRHFNLDISIYGESVPPLPFPNNSFDVVYARQVLHHIPDLDIGLREIHRVLKSKGTILSTRDHAVKNQQELRVFLDAHPLHKHYHGENAFRLDEYRSAFHAAGFRIQRELGHFESVINFYPGTDSDRRAWIQGRARERWGVLGSVAARFATVRSLITPMLQAEHSFPGWLVSFLAKKE